MSAICPECGANNEAASDVAAVVTAQCASCSAPLALHERYVLRSVLGEAIGTTYRADDSHTGEAVVVKELAFSRLDSWKTEELFQREAAVLRQLDHPRIPNYVDHFALGAGKRQRFYLVQQHLVGRDLRRELDTRRYSEPEVLALLDEVLALLEYLQSLRPPLIHRDIKPSNLMRLDRDGSVALIDFGSVRDLIAPVGDSPTVAGTFGFMAPEQFQGEAYLQTDIYGLGGVALQLLSRMPPEKMLSSTMQLAWREHVKASPPLASLLDDFLQADYRARPESASAARVRVRETLAELDGGSASARSQARPHPAFASIPSAGTAARVVDAAATRGSRRDTTGRRAIVIMLVCVVALAMGVGALVFLSADSQSVAEPPPPARPAVGTVAPEPRARVAKVARPAAVKASIAKLSEAELAELLVASRWQGTLRGTLVFAQKGKKLTAALQAGERVTARFSVELGVLGSLTLERSGKSSTTTTVTETFYGALSADHQRISGRWERDYRSGKHTYAKRGTWSVRARRAGVGAPR